MSIAISRNNTPMYNMNSMRSNGAILVDITVDVVYLVVVIVANPEASGDMPIKSAQIIFLIHILGF